MKIVFIRHGESEANVKRIISNTGYKYGLTEKGQDQAAEVAKKLKDKYPDPARIISSPLKRADQTAGIIGRQFGKDHIIDNRIIEFHTGELEDTSDVESWERFSLIWKQWLSGESLSEGLPGGESLLDVMARLEEFLKEITMQYNEDDTLLCVTHGGVLIMGLTNVLDIKNIEDLKDFYLKNTDIVEIEFDQDSGFVCKGFGPL